MDNYKYGIIGDLCELVQTLAQGVGECKNKPRHQWTGSGLYSVIINEDNKEIVSHKRQNRSQGRHIGGVDIVHNEESRYECRRLAAGALGGTSSDYRGTTA